MDNSETPKKANQPESIQTESGQRRSFPLGRTVQTSGALSVLNQEDVLRAIARHSLCDWGECCTKDVAENEFSLKEGFRLLSVYRDRNGVKFWIITEADRSVTTALLPEEY